VKLILVAAAVLVLACVLALFTMNVIYRAMGNLIDWLILTFGNEEAVRELKRRRELPP
jgi:hypothetical protein